MYARRRDTQLSTLWPRDRRFSLVEIMIAVGIIPILSAIDVPKFTDMTR